MGISVEEAIHELRNREEVFVAYSQATKLPYVTCDDETFNDQARIFATEEEIKEDNTKAVNYYQKSIIVNPDYTDGWFNLGLAYANENNLIESQKSFEKVIALDPDYNFGYAYYALGMALEHQGKKPEAIKNYKLFIKHNNDKEMINTVQTKIKQLQ